MAFRARRGFYLASSIINFNQSRVSRGAHRVWSSRPSIFHCIRGYTTTLMKRRHVYRSDTDGGGGKIKNRVAFNGFSYFGPPGQLLRVLFLDPRLCYFCSILIGGPWTIRYRPAASCPTAKVAYPRLPWTRCDTAERPTTNLNLTCGRCQ